VRDKRSFSQWPEITANLGMIIMQNTTIKLKEFLGKVNAYSLSFLDRSVTGRLIEADNGFIKIQLRSGDVICCHIDCLKSIWNIRQPQEAV